jgi:hypothetical protein
MAMDPLLGGGSLTSEQLGFAVGDALPRRYLPRETSDALTLPVGIAPGGMFIL